MRACSLLLSSPAAVNTTATALSASLSHLSVYSVLVCCRDSLSPVEYEQIVQGTKLRVDPHLPVYLQQLQKNRGGAKAAQDGGAEEEKSWGIVSEDVGMVLCLIIIAVLAAIS